MKLNRAIPGSMGVKSADIKKFLDKVNEEKCEFHSFMLVKGGNVISECWWEPYGPNFRHQMFSLSKSFTSTAIGFLADEGKVTVDDLVADIFADEIKQLGEDVDPKIFKMTVKNLLTMGTGMAYENWVWDDNSSNNNILGFLSSHIKNEPGSEFFYHTLATYMQSAIVTKKTGQKLVDYLKPRLFDLLGIDPVWEEDKLGISFGGFGLNITTEDIAKLGQLYLQKGVWEGRRILSEKWIDEATTKQISNGSDENSDWAQGYGYQFWVCKPKNVYRGDGMYGQYCIVMPDQDCVVAITSNHDMQKTLNLIWDYLLPALGNDKADESCSDLSELRKTEKAMTHLIPDEKISPLPKLRREYMLDCPNTQGFMEKFYMETLGEEVILALYKKNKDDELPGVCKFANGGWADNISANIFEYNNSRKLFRLKTFCSYKEENRCMNMICWFYETPVKIRFGLSFSEDFREITLKVDDHNETVRYKAVN